MTTYVLVHGASLGGWVWRDVAVRLAAAGHEVHRPSLTGQGDRVHLAAQASLESHILDIVNLVLHEDLRDVVLCGHSYGGVVVTGVADRIPERIATLFYFDALVPVDGQSATDVRQQFVHDMQTLADPYRVRPDQQAWVNAKLTDLPLNCRSDSIRLSGAQADVRRTVYGRAVKHPSIALDALLARAKARPGWETVEIEALHCGMIDAPDAVAAALLAVA